MGRLYKNVFKTPTNTRGRNITTTCNVKEGHKKSTKEHVFERQKQYYKGMAQQKQHDTKIGHKNNNIQNAKEGIIIAM